MLGCKPDYERSCQDLLTEMCQRHPEIGLSFGYIGNVTRGGADERSWAFFTKVLDPADTFYKNCFSFGGVPTERLKEFWESALENLEQWIVETVEPHKGEVHRVFNVDVKLRCDSPAVERILEHDLGCSFGARGECHFNVSLQHMTLDELKAKLDAYPVTIRQE